MINAVGGNPDACTLRAECLGMTEKEYILNVAGTDPWPENSYGNNSVADDFAESFSQAVNGGNVPAARLTYINVMIGISAGAMGQP